MGNPPWLKEGEQTVIDVREFKTTGDKVAALALSPFSIEGENAQEQLGILTMLLARLAILTNHSKAEFLKAVGATYDQEAEECWRKDKQQ